MQSIINFFSNNGFKTTFIQMNEREGDIENSRLLKEKLLSIIEKEGCLEKVVAILEELIEKSDSHNRDKVAQSICDVFIAFPPHFQETLLKNTPIFFVQLIEFWNIKQREKVLNHLTEEFENWKELLVQIFEILDFKEEGKKPHEKLPGRFLAYLLESFSSHHKREWIEYCSIGMNYNPRAFFFISLKKEDFKFAMQEINQTFEYDLSENGFLFFFEAFATHMDQHSVEIKTILESVLDRFNQANKFKVIIDQFENLTTAAQVCLLNAMTPSKQSQVLNRYQKDAYLMSQLFDQLFFLQNEFDEQRKVVERFGQALAQENLSEFIQFLLSNDCKLGAYLLVCLPDETFQNFIYDVDVNLRTAILLKSEFNSTTEELLCFASLERKKNIYKSMRLASKEVSIHPYTAREFLDSLEGGVDDDMLVNYTSSLICIPPFIIGLAAKMRNHSELLKRLAPFMSEEQLKFFVCTLDQLEFYAFVENPNLSLGFGRLEILLKVLSIEKMTYYTQRKTEDLKKARKEFHDKYSQLQTALDEIEEGEVLLSTDVERLEDQAMKLNILARMPLKSEYHYLSRVLKDLKQCHVSSDFQVIIDEFEKSKDQLKSKCDLFKKPHGIIANQLDIIKSCMLVEKEEEGAIDLTRILYDGFWMVVRDGTLPYLGISPHSGLGITDVNQLSCLGILSDRDLEYLGISAELQTHVTNIVLELEKIQVIKPKKDNGKDEPTISELWNECTQIKLSKEEVLSKSQQIVNILNRSSIASSNFKKGIGDFCCALLKFPHLSPEDISKIRRECTLLKKARGNAMISNGKSLLIKALILLRSQHPLFRLEHYLIGNVNLKQTWEKLRLNGYDSIHDLFEKQLINHRSDLLRLEEVANNLGQPMEVIS